MAEELKDAIETAKAERARPAVSVVLADGTLVGVPFLKDAYGAQLDRSQWGLIEVARLEN